MRITDLFIHVYGFPGWFWGIALALALLDVWATWQIGRAVRISGRPWLSASRRMWVNGAILASFLPLSVLRFYHRAVLALGWFLGSQLLIGLISIRPLAARVLAMRRSALSGRPASSRPLSPAAPLLGPRLHR